MKRILYLPLAVLILLASCMTPQKAVNYLKDHDKLSEACAENYPVDTVTHVKSDTTVKYDTSFSTVTLTLYKTDTAYSHDTVFITKTRVDTVVQTRTKTVTNTVTIEKIDNAKIAVLNKTIAERDQTITQRDKAVADLKSKRDWWRKIALWSIGINLAFIAFFFRGAISGLLGGIIKQVIKV